MQPQIDVVIPCKNPLSNLGEEMKIVANIKILPFAGTREKQIYDCIIQSIDGTMATITLETESGTYIKELISGDDGRTKPSISEMIGVPCKVVELDVIQIKGE